MNIELTRCEIQVQAVDGAERRHEACKLRVAVWVGRCGYTDDLQWIWVRGKAPAREDENTAEALDEGIGLCAYSYSCLALSSAAETQGRQWRRCRSA
jgi:hypothetical protein